MATYRKIRHTRETKDEQRPGGAVFSYYTTVFIGLVFSSVLFLTAAFLYLHLLNSGDQGKLIILPKSFPVVTVLSLISSFIAFRLQEYYRDDNSASLKYSLLLMILLALVSGILTGVSCNHLISEIKSFPFAWNKQTAFLLLNGIYLIHLTGGIFYLLRFTNITSVWTSDIARSLLYYTDHVQETRIRMVTIFWHYINAVWVLMYFLFLFTN
jgi:cytochrome c oxidase subunit III